ncbi:hypothetical protein B0H12DRAFT_1093900 [Mycena haematopus]|nr:hypothetical protein B0H12DRAFT_1093900 [Mycena haematopus]
MSGKVSVCTLLALILFVLSSIDFEARELKLVSGYDSLAARRRATPCCDGQCDGAPSLRVVGSSPLARRRWCLPVRPEKAVAPRSQYDSSLRMKFFLLSLSSSSRGRGVVQRANTSPRHSWRERQVLSPFRVRF